jgi:uncharacterized protein YbjT (DUF2867 family)
MRILVLGATGGTGRAVVAAALAAGHGVTAVARTAARLEALAPGAEGLTRVAGDATDPALMARLAPGHDAHVIALGEYPHPLVFLPGPQRRSSRAICSRGTAALLAALPPRARVLAVTAYGVGATRATAPWYFRLYFWLFLPALFADKERQEAALAASAADYLIAQPVGLTDKPATGRMLASPEGAIRGATVSRADVAAFLLAEIERPGHHRAAVALSG